MNKMKMYLLENSFVPSFILTKDRIVDRKLKYIATNTSTTSYNPTFLFKAEKMWLLSFPWFTRFSVFLIVHINVYTQSLIK